MKNIFKKMQRLVKKISRHVSAHYTYYMNHYFGEYSIQRRLRSMPSTQVNRELHRLDLKLKKVLIAVAHCDDEVIFANTVLTSDEPALKDLFVIHDGRSSRNHTIKQVAKLANANLQHLKIIENIHPKGDSRYIFIPESDVKKIKLALKKKIQSVDYDYIFTHNEFGEYGHGQHRQVCQIVKDVVRETKCNSTLIFFGYAYPSLFNEGTTFWPETLKVFATDRKWTRRSDVSVRPFRGIFKFKKYPEYFFHDINCYLPQKNKKLMLKLAESYSDVKDAWTGFLRKNNHYYKYLSNHVQYFSNPSPACKKYIEYEWPTFTLTPPHPATSKPPKPKRVDNVRAFLDDYLIDYLHFEGDVLWVGWNEFCMKNNYLTRMLKYVDNLDILDNNELRRSKEIYGEQTANIIGDICNLKGIIENEKYDCILCNGVLEYVDSIEDAVSECTRTLKKRGRILFGIPGYDWEATGKNRSQFEYIIDLIYKNNLLPIEVWRRANPDYYYIHAYKPAGG